jgi:hypothetical protein
MRFIKGFWIVMVVSVALTLTSPQRLASDSAATFKHVDIVIGTQGVADKRCLMACCLRCRLDTVHVSQHIFKPHHVPLSSGEG